MNWNVNLNLYRSFYYVVRYGGFTKASNEISISQSTLSNNIKKLESELGNNLFVRTSSKVELTPYGENLYSKIKQIKNILVTNTEQININIGALRFIADNYLSEAIVKLYQNNKNIKLNLQILDSGKLYQKLKRNELDFVISRTPTFYKFEENISIIELCNTKNIFVCSKEFYEKNKDNFKNKDYQFPLILPNHSEKRRVVEKYLKENSYNYSIISEIPNSNLLKKLITLGLGIGYINEDFIKQQLKSKELIVVKQFKNPPIDTICLLYNKKNITKYSKDFINVIKLTIQKLNT